MTNTFDIFTGAIRALNTLSGYLNSQEKKSTGNENDIAADNVLSSNFKTKNQQHSKKVYFQKDDTKIWLEKMTPKFDSKNMTLKYDSKV